MLLDVIMRQEFLDHLRVAEVARGGDALAVGKHSQMLILALHKALQVIPITVVYYLFQFMVGHLLPRMRML